MKQRLVLMWVSLFIFLGRKNGLLGQGLVRHITLEEIGEGNQSDAWLSIQTLFSQPGAVVSLPLKALHRLAFCLDLQAVKTHMYFDFLRRNWVI